MAEIIRQTVPGATHLMGDPEVQHIDIRLFFPKDSLSHEELLDYIQEALENHMQLQSLISGYEIENDGFGNLTAADLPFV